MKRCAHVTPVCRRANNQCIRVLNFFAHYVSVIFRQDACSFFPAYHAGCVEFMVSLHTSIHSIYSSVDSDSVIDLRSEATVPFFFEGFR